MADGRNIITLAPKYFAEYDDANSPGYIHDMFLYDGVKYDYTDMGVESAAGNLKQARTVFLYQTSGLEAYSVNTSVQFEVSYLSSAELPEHTVSVTPLVMKRNVNAGWYTTSSYVRHYAASKTKTFRFEPNSVKNYICTFEFSSSYRFSSEALLGLEIAFEFRDNEVYDRASIELTKPPVIEISGDTSNYTSVYAYYPRQMANEIRGIKNHLERSSHKLANPPSGVIFYDYDGRILHSYAADEFLLLAEMPENPERKGLTAQGWNWTLEKAKEHVSKYGNLDIGQNYITDDGKTRLYVHVLEEVYAYRVRFHYEGRIAVDWGDGKTSYTGSENEAYTDIFDETHTYTEEGDYVISIAVTSGGRAWFGGEEKRGLYEDNPTLDWTLTRLEVGLNFEIRNYAFSNSRRLEAVSLPISLSKIEHGGFMSCDSLYGIVIPSSMKALESNSDDAHDYETFLGCSALSFVSFPAGFQRIGSYAFSGCEHLLHATIPESVTSIGEDAFLGCAHLTYAVIPDNMESISHRMFGSCISLQSLSLPDSISQIEAYALGGCGFRRFVLPPKVTVVSAYLFADCRSLNSIHFLGKITEIQDGAFENCTGFASFSIPDTVTAIGAEAFKGDNGLLRIEIPASVESVGVEAFSACTALTVIDIGANVETIGDSAFRDCSSVRTIIFRGSTPPTMESSAFYNVAPDITTFVFVPRGSLADYESAANRPAGIYIEYGPEDDPTSSIVTAGILNNTTLKLDGNGIQVVDDIVVVNSQDVSVDEDPLYGTKLAFHNT